MSLAGSQERRRHSCSGRARLRRDGSRPHRSGRTFSCSGRCRAKLETILPAVKDLGRRHVGYGVEPAHYETVGTALIATLEKGLGSGFTPEVRAAWIEAYTALAAVMQDAAAGVGAPAKATA